MADKRISQLIERVDIANNDVLPIVASGATTTNKVTISTIQTWMQDNLDVGVTSVGITIGTSGTDVNVSGSPITTSGNITINIPDASASARGVVTTGSQTFAGVKTFSNGLSLSAVGGSNQVTRIVNIGTLHEGTASLNQIGFNSGNNIYFGKGLSNGGVISWNNAAVRYYTLPDADGTLALASQLDGYVTLGTAQTITGQKTFNSTIVGQNATLTSSGSGQTLLVTHSSGSGIALDITKAGDGEGLRVAKTSGSGNAVTITGGTLSAEAGQFSGDLQSATRVIAAASGESIILTPNSGGTTNRVESGGTLPLALVSAAAITLAAGGTTPQITLASTGAVTLTGALNGTSGTFSGGLVSNGGAIGYGGGELGFGVTTSGASSAIYTLATGSPVIFFDHRATGNTGSFVFRNGSGGANTLLSISSTGAATFSSSVTATSFVVGNGQFYRATRSSGSLVTDMIGIPSGTDDVRILSTGDINFVNGSLTNLLSIKNGGNVGIGTASPESGWKFDVSGLATMGGTAGNGRLYISTEGTTNGATYLQARNLSVATPLHFFSSVNYFQSNVGIGTTSPSSILETIGQVTIDGAASGAGIGTLQLKGAKSDSNGFNLTFNNSTNIASINLFYGGTLTFGTGNTERMRITSGGFLKASNTGSYFNVSASYHEVVSNVTGVATQVIQHRGTDPYGIYMNFTASPNNTTNYFLICSDASLNRFIIYSNGNVANTNNSYGAISDIKLKENIKDASPKLDDLMKVKVRNYNLIGDDKKQIGVIAQELEEVFPAMIDESEDFEEVEVSVLDEEGNEVLNEEGEVVTTKERVSKGTTTKSVKYSVFVPMLIKAIQELKAEIDSLKNQIK